MVLFPTYSVLTSSDSPLDLNLLLDLCNCNESIFTDSCTYYQTFFYNKECKDKQNIRKDKFYFSCGKINKYDHLQHIFQIHFHKMRQIIVYDNSISTCMGNFYKTEFFFQIM